MSKSAGLILIGDEILSGRTQDKNTSEIAKRLGEIGIQLYEVRIIPDHIPVIIQTVQHFSSSFDYVFTTGGIGPTPDDKTAEAMAQAFGRSLKKNPEAMQILIDHYGGEDHMNEGWVKMTLIPEGATLIPNLVSAAPGFKIKNVHVMAGVPKIMQSMLDHIIPTLEGGAIIKSKQIIVHRPESELLGLLQDMEDKFPTIAIGSYPKYQDGKPEVTLVLRGTDDHVLEQAYKKLNLALQTL